MSRWLPILITLTLVLPAVGCRVARYPAENSLPDPVPDPPTEVEAEVKALWAESAASTALKGKLERVVEAGRSLIGKAEVVLDEVKYRGDCSGFVEGCFASVGVVFEDGSGRLVSGSEAIFRALSSQGVVHHDDIPIPGDLVFFSNTYDRDHDGKVDDHYTHVGFVDSVAEDGTVRFLHYIGGASRIGRMNRVHPEVHADPETGAIWNDFLRRRHSDDGEDVHYLAAELFAGFGRVPGTAPEAAEAPAK